LLAWMVKPYLVLPMPFLTMLALKALESGNWEEEKGR
jgi:hypothetical protein